MTALVDNLAYLLSRVAFVMTFVVIAVWIIFVTNDPFDIRTLAPRLLNTLDVDASELEDCSEVSNNINFSAVQCNTLVFLVLWWIPHSGLARNVVKQALGLGPKHPLDRPIYAFLSPFSWWITIVLWKPITACSRLDVTAISLTEYLWRVPIVLPFMIEVLGLWYLHPNHLWGTDRHTWSTQMPEKQELIIKFPYGLVRHPAAAAFLWLYWVAIPSYNPNHLLLSTLWSVFIVVGTLVFEEGGLRGQTGEFGKEYAEYAGKVNAFWPSVWSLKHQFGFLHKAQNGKSD